MTTPFFYTYVLIDPRTYSPFYVGKGKHERIYQHERYSHNDYLLRKINKIKSLGYKIIYEKWFESEDEWFCFWMENYLIDYFGIDNLCNFTLNTHQVNL